MKKVKNVKLMNGSGLSQHCYNREEKMVSIDFDGYSEWDKESCFRNDASILFFVAKSYRVSGRKLEEQIDNGFESDSREIVERLILPYYFCFRHFVELELKAFYVSATKSKYERSHDVIKLFNHVKEAILEIKRDDRPGIFRITDEKYIDIMEKIEKCLLVLETKISDYFSKEPGVEYYRFLFSTDYELKNSCITLSLNDEKVKQNEIAVLFEGLFRLIHEIHYIYEI